MYPTKGKARTDMSALKSRLVLNRSRRVSPSTQKTYLFGISTYFIAYPNRLSEFTEAQKVLIKV